VITKSKRRQEQNKGCARERQQKTKIDKTIDKIDRKRK